MTSVSDLLAWTPWRPFSSASSDPALPRLPGLYRIRRVGREEIDYIGQTGMRLTQRLAMLRGIYAEEMPYRDPHTAAPALWALRHATGCDFEVSVAPVAGATPWRKGLEALVVGLYRQQYGCSPTVEFGRVPVGYQASSGNNARLMRLGKLFRGGPAPELIHANHAPGIPPAGRFDGSPQDFCWVGHQWSGWTPLGPSIRHAVGGSRGLYRIRGDDASRLLYVGQGRIADRLLAHLAKRSRPNYPQGQFFGSQSRIECSWVANDTWLHHQRLELVNDLIASHIVSTEAIPDAQFIG